MKVGAVILAAGASSRMGSPKALLPWEGTSFVAHVTDVAREAGLDPVVVVTGAEHAGIVTALEGRGADCIENAGWREGMASSLRAGADAGFGRGCDALVVLLADQPEVTADHLTRLVQACARASLAGTDHGGRPGAPAAFARSWWPKLAALRGDRGAQSILVESGAPLVSPSRPIRDFDSPADLR